MTTAQSLGCGVGLKRLGPSSLLHLPPSFLRLICARSIHPHNNGNNGGGGGGNGMVVVSVLSPRPAI